MGNQCDDPERRDHRKPPQKSTVLPSAVKGKAYNYLYQLVLISDLDTGKTSCLLRYAGDKFDSTYMHWSSILSRSSGVCHCL